MAVKSQIDVNVNDKEFAEFRKQWDKFSDALNKLPNSWKVLNEAAKDSKERYLAVADTLAIVGASMAGINKNTQEFYRVTTSTSRHWHNLAISTASVAKNIVGATESLLKWTGIISLVTGGAGLFGFDRFAQSVSGQRTAALGTGTTYGARAAFLTNFRRLGDPEGLLARAAEAQTNIKESRAFRMLGLTDADLKGDPTDVAIKALRSAGRIAREDKRIGRPVGSEPRLEAYDTQTRIRLRDIPESELEELIAKMRADQKSGRLNLSPADQKGYQDFTTRMEAAGKAIETIFVKGLVKLAGPLSELSDATVKLVDKFTDKALPVFIKDLAGGIDWLAKEVDKPSFVEKVESIVGMIGSLAGAFGGIFGGLARFARWLGVASPSNVDFTSGTQPGSGRGGEVNLSDPKYHGGKGAGGRRGFAARAGGSTWAGSTPENTVAALAAARDQLRAEGVPEEHLDAAAEALVGNAIAESGLNPRASHDHGTGYGIYGARLERRTRQAAWLAAHGFSGDSLAGQSRQMAHDAMTNPRFAATRNALMNATDATTAGDVVERNFEVPKVLNNRHAAFRQAHQANVHIHSQPGGNVGLSSAAAAAGSP